MLLGVIKMLFCGFSSIWGGVVRLWSFCFGRGDCICECFLWEEVREGFEFLNFFFFWELWFMKCCCVLRVEIGALELGRYLYVVVYKECYVVIIIVMWFFCYL